MAPGRCAPTCGRLPTAARPCLPPAPGASRSPAGGWGWGGTQSPCRPSHRPRAQAPPGAGGLSPDSRPPSGPRAPRRPRGPQRPAPPVSESGKGGSKGCRREKRVPPRCRGPTHTEGRDGGGAPAPASLALCGPRGLCGGAAPNSSPKVPDNSPEGAGQRSVGRRGRGGARGVGRREERARGRPRAPRALVPSSGSGAADPSAEGCRAGDRSCEEERCCAWPWAWGWSSDELEKEDPCLREAERRGDPSRKAAPLLHPAVSCCAPTAAPAGASQTPGGA